MDLTQWKFEICTAPSMCSTGGCESLLPIKMEAIKSYRLDEILKASEQCQRQNPETGEPESFRTILERTLNGTEPDWVLWKVLLQADRLELSYLCKRTRKTADGGDVRSQALIAVENPMTLGLRFCVPELGPKYPAMVYECWMSGSAKGGAHNIRLIEINHQAGLSAELNLSLRHEST